MAHGSVAVPYCWDQCFVPHGTGAGLTEEGLCCWLTRLGTFGLGQTGQTFRLPVLPQG
jgi:hypothetical protein